MNELQISEIARNYGLIIGGLIGLYFAWKRVSASIRQADASLQQADLARRDHVAELFNRSVGQLTNDKLEIRLGAIYTLRQIAQDFPDLSAPTLELLATYLRKVRRPMVTTNHPLTCGRSWASSEIAWHNHD
jgi:hypothetical protein